MNTEMRMPEILAPAGNMDKLTTCLRYGADAVYLGGKSGNLRSACEGFSMDELAKAVGEARPFGAKVYYCLNSFAMEKDLPSLPEQIEGAAQAGVHGFIIADPGVFSLANRLAPDVPIHISTQANTCNSETAAFWAGLGATRVNLARELTCRDIFAIRKAIPDMELEVFVHGAMCLAVSGQCLLSAWLNGRSGNQGRCTQPCRFEYRELEPDSASGSLAGLEDIDLVVEEATRPGEALWTVRHDRPFSSFWAPQDLCLLPWLPWFVHNRIDALKIEGRMKSSGWIAHALDAYRFSLDCIRAGLQAGDAENLQAVEETFPSTKNCMYQGMKELLYGATRPLGSGFFIYGKRRNLTEEWMRENGWQARRNRSGESLLPELGRRTLARVLEPAGQGVWLVEAHGNWSRERDVELMLPGMRRPILIGQSYGLENQRGELVGRLGNGTRGMLYADNEDIVPGVFVREAD